MSIKALKESLIKIKDYKEQIKSLKDINLTKEGWNDDSIRVINIQHNSFNRLLSKEMDIMRVYREQTLQIKEELDEVEKLYDCMFQTNQIVIKKSYEEVKSPGRKREDVSKTVKVKHKLRVIPLEGMAELKESLGKPVQKRCKYLIKPVKEQLRAMSKDSIINKSYEQLCKEYKSGKLIIR